MRLKTNNVSIELGGRNILEDININVAQGEFVGLIGPNGSGKSTLLKNIYRVLKADTGLIYLDEDNLARQPLKVTAKKMAVVKQFNNFSFDFRVEEIVMMGRAPHKSMFEFENINDYQVIYDSLEKVNMLEYAKRSFSTLSGGEKQRVLLARALAQRTDFLVLDEPTNHLDIRYKLEILDLIKSLDMEVLAAIHDLNLAVSYCDRIYVMKEGKIVAEGNPGQVISEELLKEVYQIEARVRKDTETGQLSIIYLPDHHLKSNTA
ncbi:iron complex transport system ATP-binding protein [Halanaerobium saccharolyticum]|uniref:Iron complex transport system ATP-binding protein n=1 Tax=Halanaerobium saccharolyticum TaxID=43595 RepID=A0A4R7Z7T0_9FIRM|nr:ABC transporter ATP-binding protein [Halanaerobium saccharolyticum]RAK10586.1 iron complex transport system ATP-binding protein [Halanaerobium saccharolyticum]TDW06657.1 iron complex transport system ATP-binding protein [Halanaerobium saccharolyticum]TDX62292.1 iron complex transport system ATP-binding protein [Halanaerobium saccharolyticum]